MSDSATLTIEMSRTAMTAASRTASVIAPLGPVMAVDEARVGLAIRPHSARRDLDDGAHAGSERGVGRGVEAHQHGDPLHDLDEVARGVVGRDEREARARSTGDAVDVGGEATSGKRVDRN